MNVYFMILVAFYILGLGIYLSKHGEYAYIKYNFWERLLTGGIQVLLVYLAIKTGF